MARTRSLPRRGAAARRKSRGASRAPRRRRDPIAERLFAAERLYQDFRELTPYPFRPLAISFASFAAYERWRRAQKSPWYR